MTNSKLAIIGGSGLYEIEGLKEPKWKKIKTPWGDPSDKILNFSYKGKKVCFLPRHARGHKISHTNINFRAKGFPSELIDNEPEEKGYEI